jgi:putative endonuclease
MDKRPAHTPPGPAHPHLTRPGPPNPDLTRPSPARPDPRRRLGALGEQLAAEHLERLGYRIVGRNYRTRWGELDLIAHDGRLLAFVEVKTRCVSGGAGSPFEAVDRRKQAQVRRIAAGWLTEVSDRPRAEDLRFDVIGVTVDGAGRLIELEHREGVF